MTGMIFMENGLVQHTLPRPSGLLELPVVLDVGAGIRPMNWFKPARHICVEPHKAYADKLKDAGYEVVRKTALKALSTHYDDPAIYLLDSIEHMERDEGATVIKLAKEQARQIVVSTPFGFKPQEGDAWDMGGEKWQKHRSGWKPADFPGWRITLFSNYFVAVWTASTHN